MAENINSEQSIISAIWILSCTDKIPQMTYKAIEDRLSIPKNIDFKELIKNKAELFRLGIPSKQLDEWKNKMSSGKFRSNWIANSPNRELIIDNIRKSDIFRNRFRNTVDAKEVPIEIIQWGLTHIDQIYSQKSRTKENKYKWITSYLVPLLSLVLAFSSIFFSYLNSSDQHKLKQYELSLIPKQVGYTDFMANLGKSYYAAKNRDKTSMYLSLDEMKGAYYKVQPFIGKLKADEIWEQLNNFEATCVINIKTDSLVDDSEKFITYRKYFEKVMSSELIYDQ